MKPIAIWLALLSPFVVSAEEPFVLGGDAKKGEDLYKMLCIQCHGEKGRGDGPAATAASLNPKPTNFADPANASRLTDEWVFRVIKDGGPKHGKSALMVSWSGSLDDQQLRHVAAFVLRFKRAPPPKK